MVSSSTSSSSSSSSSFLRLMGQHQPRTRVCASDCGSNRASALHPLRKNASSAIMVGFQKRHNRRRRRQWRSAGALVVVVVIALAAVAVVVLLWRSFQQREPNSNGVNVAKIRMATTPFESHPPDAIVLAALGANSTNTASGPRHECLQHIRARHAASFGRFFEHAKHVLLVDPAYHSNVGDHMITVAELEFLLRNIIRTATTTTTGTANAAAATATVAQCSYAQAGNYVPKCDDVLQNELLAAPSISHSAATTAAATATTTNDAATTNKVAVWHGGGNFGDLWPLAQEPRIRSFVPLLQAGYVIVTMPNSWYYSNAGTQARDVQRIRHNIAVGLGLFDSSSSSSSSPATITVSDDELAVAAKDRVVLSWREHVSYERGVEHFPFCTNLLVPDIAFQLGPYRSLPPPPPPVPLRDVTATTTTTAMTDILLLLRDDHESVYASQRNRQAIRDVLQSVTGGTAQEQKQLTYSIVDWKDRLHRFDSTDIFFTDTAIQLLSLGRVVICDRLHAAILAYLAGLPFVYLDQVSGKVTKTLTVAMESDASCQQEANWSRAHNLTDAVGQAVKLLEQYQTKGLTREQRRDRLRKTLNQKVPL